MIWTSETITSYVITVIISIIIIIIIIISSIILFIVIIIIMIIRGSISDKLQEVDCRMFSIDLKIPKPSVEQLHRRLTERTARRLPKRYAVRFPAARHLEVVAAD